MDNSGHPQSFYPPQRGIGYADPQQVNYQSPSPNQPQQQQQVFMVSNQPTGPVVVVAAQPAVSMVGAIVLSCFVFWCCGWLFGGIAFILAMVGHSSAASGDTIGALQLRKASYGLSIAGIVIGIIIAAVIGGIVGSAASKVVYNTNYQTNYPTNSYNTCYKYNSLGYLATYNC